MAQWADASSTNQIEHSSLDVHLADFDPNYDPSYDLEANCPMCRTRTSASPDKPLARQLEAKYPVTYAERRVEEEVDRGSRVGQDGLEGVMILIGNKHRLIRNPGSSNVHLWTFFVRTSRPELIKEVHLYLVSFKVSSCFSVMWDVKAGIWCKCWVNRICSRSPMSSVGTGGGHDLINDKNMHGLPLFSFYPGS